MDTSDAPVPLKAPPDQPRCILAAVDASAGARRVVEMAARMTRAMPEAAVHVLHVFKMSRLDRARAGAPAVEQDAVEEAKEHLAYCVKTLRSMTRAQVIQHFAVGDPAHEVLRTAAELDTDLLVVGTHDHVGLERFLLGSVAETLMRRVGCPILVVRPKSYKG